MNNSGQHKLNYINAVRGLAILLVIVLHVANATKGLSKSVKSITNIGAFGVQLFFVASAFTLFRSYTSRIKKEGRFTKRNFFVRRLARISPMYYVAAVVYSIICYYKPAYNGGNSLELWKVLANVFYVNSFLPGAIMYIPPGGWSVGVEMVFYCCMPFLFSHVKNFKNAFVWFVLLSMVALGLTLLEWYLHAHFLIVFTKQQAWFLYFWFPNHAAVFMLGIMLYFALQLFKIKRRGNTYIGLTTSILLMCGFIGLTRYIDPHKFIPQHIVISVFFAINIFFLAQHPAMLFNNKVTRFLGEISFSLYLVHFIVVYVLADYFPLSANPYSRFFELYGLTILISCGIATLTYRFIERPGIAAGSRFIKRKSPQPELEPGI
ncbi:MAG TPA: acyltransferase [Chitinophagaceae bacterium]|nr:acyltransferase [Chitinophagaceae bacterium]